MFERFTEEARSIVVDARRQRDDLEHRRIGTEHLLLALAESDDAAGEVLRQHGLTRHILAGDLTDVLANPSSTNESDDDRALLLRLGVDLDAVRAQADDDFGEGSLEHARHLRRHRSRLERLRRPWGRPPGLPRAGGFSPRAITAIELSLREALRLRSKTIGAEHLGLGLLREGDGLGCLLLARRSTSIDDLTEDWEALSLTSA